jgi:hypothetical protein
LSPSPPAEARAGGNPSRFWSNNPLTGRSQRPIFVAATKQHVGKTTTCLALLSGLKKRFNNVGFLKPVGQQHVDVVDNNNNQLRVDKDVVLIKEHFHLDHIDYSYMSPVIIPSGYTKRYVDGEITLESQKHEVERAMEQVAADSDITLIEGTKTISRVCEGGLLQAVFVFIGISCLIQNFLFLFSLFFSFHPLLGTGHCAVGSIVGLNNAQVASLLGADMVLM